MKVKKQCSCCGKLKSQEYYYKSNSFIHKYDNLMPVCKTCIQENTDIENMRSVMNMLRMLDKPFIYELYLQALDSAKETGKGKSNNALGHYFRMLAMPQYNDKNWDDSIFNEDYIIANQNQKIDIEFSNEELDKLFDFWGRGFEKEDYEFLENEYARLKSSYQSDGYNMEILLQEIAHTRLAIKKKRELGESPNKDIKDLQELMGTANLKPVQETGANAGEQKTFGVLIKEWENNKPIPEPLPELRDVDNLKKYINIWFFGHFAKMLGLKNDKRKEYEEELEKYTVSKDEDDD